MAGVVWYVRFRGPDGRLVRKRTQCRTRAQAEELARDLEQKATRQRNGLEVLPPKDGGGTVAELLEWWAEQIEGKPSAYGVGLGVRKHLLPSDLAHLTLMQLRPADVEQLLAEKEKEGLGPQTRKHLRSYLSRAFSLAKVRGRWHGTNPIDLVGNVKVPKPSVEDWLRAHEVPKVLGALEPKDRPLFACAIYTGMRKGELCSLQKKDVDLDAGLITVRRSWGRDRVKGGRTLTIPIHDELGPFLKEAIDASPSALVFPGPDGKMRREDVKLSQKLRAAMGLAGITTGYRHVCRAWHCDHAEDAPDAGPRYCPMQHGKKPRKLWPKPVVRPLTWKDLRDTAASLYLGRGVPMAVVQKVLRHADPRITSERYAHLEQDYLGAEMRKLSLIPPSKNTGQTQGEPTSEGAANGDLETSVIPFPSKERRTGFEPATPSLGSSCSTN